MGAGVSGSSTNRNVGTVGFTHSRVTACEDCGDNFGVLTKKKKCVHCARSYCSKCVLIDPNIGTGKFCNPCRTLKTAGLTRNAVDQFKVRDLKFFLLKHGIDTAQCREKPDLVELVLFHFGGENYRQGRLQENDRQEELRELYMQLHAQNSTEGGGAEGTEGGAGDNGDIAADTPGAVPNVESDASLPPSESQENLPTQPVAASGVRRISLSEIESEGDLESLTSRQLKQLLLNNFVDYKGCVEKVELVERVKRLWRHRQMGAEKMKQAETGTSSGATGSAPAPHEGEDTAICKICMDAVIDCVFLECGHMVTCTKCGKQLSECPICRQYIVRAIHVFQQ